MHNKKRVLSFISLLSVLVLVAASPIQAVDSTWQPPGTSGWNTPGNWSTGFVPEAGEEEVAVIDNGGTATLSNPAAFEAGGLELGQLGGSLSGTLQVFSGGSLTLIDANGAPTGAANIGRDGAGVLDVRNGGSFTAEVLDVNALGSVDIGAGAGAGATVDSKGDIFNGGTITTHGPGHTFTAAGNVFLEPGSSYVVDLTSSSHTTLSTTGTVSLGGSLVVQSTGFTPSVGNSWNIFDASGFSGQVALDTSAMPALPLGQLYSFSAVSEGSTNGVFAQLAVEQRLILEINRADGTASIKNGPAGINIDGYAIQSALGALTPGTWNSLENQNISDWAVSPTSGGTANLLAELKPSTSTEVTAASPLSLGSIFQLPTPTEFGVELEDVTFKYFSADDPSAEGIVNYIGNKQHNNLVLLVDPATGEARMENQSVLSVDIQGYRIASEAGSLQEADGSWDSLDDQDAAGGGWSEANPTANQLSELNPTSESTLSNGVGFNLGDLFSVGGTEDLTFQYLFPDESEFRNGIVEFRSFDSFAPADFNEDTLVDGTDLGIWQGAYGSNAGGDANGDGDSDGADFLAWQRQFTGAAASAAAMVPEPNTLVLLLGMACPLAFMSRRK